MQKLTAKNVQKINDTLIEIFLIIKNLKQSSSSGAEFENFLMKLFVKKLKKLGFVMVSAQEWNKNYKAYKDRSIQGNFNFQDIQHLAKAQNDFLIVEKPNGSQQWPDLLIIFNGIGLPIEFKSGKSDFILWNGGRPREHCIYIFNCWGKAQTTFFLGQEILTAKESAALDADTKKVKDFVCGLNSQHAKNFCWNLYSRSMFNSNHKYFASAQKRAARQRKVMRFIADLSWTAQGL